MDSAGSPELGEAIPSNTEHAISVSLPTWRSNIGYEENEPWVINKMRSGYPRFFIHPEIRDLEVNILELSGSPKERCMIFPSAAIASACREYILARFPGLAGGGQLCNDIRMICFSPLLSSADVSSHHLDIWVVFFPEAVYTIAREFWQHTGEGTSSRRAAFARSSLKEGTLLPKEQHNYTLNNSPHRGPSRYSRGYNMAIRPIHQKRIDHAKAETSDASDFVERRYGRNLDAEAVKKAKLAIKQRISGIVDHENSLVTGKIGHYRVQKISPDNVFLFPTGMSAIYNVHQLVKALFGSRRTVEFGFPYLDTLKVLEKFGDGCLFLGNGDEKDLDELESILQKGEQIAAVFCEFPSNPLLRSPDLKRLRILANNHRFVIIVDETIGNFVNVDVLAYADILVSSLTKVFSGDSNVMGGSCVLNPEMPFYEEISKLAISIFEDNYWGEDAIFMERNSRDFASRVLRINENAEALSTLLLTWHPEIIKRVYYPKYDTSRKYYDECKCAEGGYGGLLSITFHSPEVAIKFYDTIKTAKGPSLGTNFTLTSPYALLAHYKELDWISQYGVESHLIRISVGLEDTNSLLSMFGDALKTVASSRL